MRNYFVLGTAVCMALSMTACKSSESAYKKAYEKAKENSAATTTVQQPVVQQPTTVAPVQPVTTTPVTTTPVASDGWTVVSGSGLKAYSVVIGSMSIKANAEALQQKYIAKGYAAQIQMNSQGNYRVIAATFDDRESAVRSRDAIRAEIPDAWLLTPSVAK